jgi:haloacid dehalogenase-like hydrolase
MAQVPLSRPVAVALDIAGDRINGCALGRTTSDSWKHAYLPVEHPVTVESHDRITLALTRQTTDEASNPVAQSYTGARNSDGVTTARKARHQRHAQLSTPIVRLAVFDLDRTLVPGASIVALARELAARRLIIRRHLVRAGLEHVLYQRLGSTDAQVERTRDRALSVVAGMERAPLLAAADVVALRLAAAVGPAARFLLDHHLGSGDFCVLLSSSPQELVEWVASPISVGRS